MGHFLKRLAGRSHDRSMEYRRTSSSQVATDSDRVSWVFTGSPDGRWALLTRDADDAGSQFGHRTSDMGRYRLVEGSETRYEGRLLRPNDAKVANNGTFLIADWLFIDDLACRICIFDQKGTALVDAHYGANSLLTCLSDDGRYAAVHLGSNPERSDFDELVLVWDLSTTSLLWSKQLEGGRAETMLLDTSAGLLRAETSVVGWVDYDLATGATDIGVIRESALREGNGFDVLAQVQEEISSGPPSAGRARDLIAHCESASTKLRGYPAHEARAYRVAGEIAETQGDQSAALRYWERALAVDPRVGIAKRASALRAALAGGRPTSQ